MDIEVEDGMLPVLPVTITKIGALNGGGVYTCTGQNNTININLPDNIMADMDSSAVEINLKTYAYDGATQIAAGIPYTFYDSVTDRYTGPDILFRSASFTAQGGAVSLDQSPLHNLRVESMNCWSDNWQNKNAKSFSGLAVCPSSDNNDNSISILKTSSTTVDNSGLLQLPCKTTFPLCNGRDNLYTKGMGTVNISMTLDPTKNSAFKLLDPLASITGKAYACSGGTFSNASKNLATLIVAPNSLWGATAGSAPFSTAGSIVRINYEDISPSLAGNMSRFKSVTATVTSFVVNAGTGVGTLTLVAVPVSADDSTATELMIQNVSIQAITITLGAGQTLNMFTLADKALVGGSATTLITDKGDFANDAAVKAVYVDNSKWLYCYTSASQQVKYKYLSVIGTATASPGTGTLTFAATTLGSGTDTLRNGFMIPATYNPDNVTFQYQITDANLILYQNIMKEKPNPPTYYSWVYDPISFQTQSEQTFQVMVRPNAVMLMVLCPLNGSVIASRDTVASIQMDFDQVPTTNIPLQIGSDEYNAIIMSRNYGSMATLYPFQNLIPDLPLTSTDMGKLPLMICQTNEENAQTFSITFTSSSVLTQKNGYIFQLVERTL